jgi:hypothetical protein
MMDPRSLTSPAAPATAAWFRVLTDGVIVLNGYTSADLAAHLAGADEDGTAMIRYQARHQNTEGAPATS